MKKYILNVEKFESELYTGSKYDTSPRYRGTIEINEEDYTNFIAEQVKRFTSILKDNMKRVKILSFEEFKTLYGEDINGNAVCPKCGSIIHKDDWEYENCCWYCGFMSDKEG